MEPEMVQISAIKVDRRLQARQWMEESAIAEWADAIKALRAAGGSPAFPPVRLVREGALLWLVDGFHRHAAFTRAGETEIKAHVTDGTFRDALLMACGVNTDHGIRRTNADKEKAIGILLRDPEWSKLSDRRIAELTGTTHPTVGKLRATVKPQHPRAADPAVVNLTAEDLPAVDDEQLARLWLCWDIVAGQRPHILASGAQVELHRRWKVRRVASADEAKLLYSPTGAPSGQRYGYGHKENAWEFQGRPVIEVYLRSIGRYHEFTLHEAMKRKGYYDTVAVGLAYGPWSTEAELAELVALGLTRDLAVDGVYGRSFKGNGKEYVIGRPKFRAGFGLLPITLNNKPFELSDEQKAAGVPQESPDTRWREEAARYYWPHENSAAADGVRAALSGLPIAPPDNLVTSARDEWLAGHWLGRWRRLYPEYVQGLESALIGVHDRPTQPDPVRAAEWARGNEEGRRRARAIEDLREAEAQQRRCPHDKHIQIEGELRCLWCGLLNPPDAPEECDYPPDWRVAPVPAELDDATEAAEDLDDGEE